jgi:nardilysin
MTLVVLGLEDLDSLEAMVCETFAGVSTGESPPTSIEPLGFPLECGKGTGGLSALYRVIPVKDTHSLVITWQIPPQMRHYR